MLIRRNYFHQWLTISHTEVFFLESLKSLRINYFFVFEWLWRKKQCKFSWRNKQNINFAWDYLRKENFKSISSWASNENGKLKINTFKNNVIFFSFISMVKKRLFFCDKFIFQLLEELQIKFISELLFFILKESKWTHCSFDKLYLSLLSSLFLEYMDQSLYYVDRNRIKKFSLCSREWNLWNK